MSSVQISATQLREILNDGDEVALLDLREEGDFTQGHLLLAASLPIGRVELDLLWRVPLKGTRIVLVGGDVQRIQRGLHLLNSVGYQRVSVLEASRSDCDKAGFGWFSGKFVPSKAFGEVVETAKETPHICTQELVALKSSGVDLLMVDSRTPEEFTDFSLPGAVSCPGAELALRVPEVISKDSVVLVNCAGRTRSIIGAQSLINAEIGCPVFALENGTMGWHLDGYDLQRGHLAMLDKVSLPTQLHSSREAAMRLLKRSGGGVISWSQLQGQLSDQRVTTYFYDVRLYGVYMEATFPGALNAPGGELVQSTDFFAPVRCARIVVADTDLVQAPMTAHWLRQMGWQADVLDPDTAPALSPAQPHATHWPHTPAPVELIDSAELQKLQDDPGVAVIDCANSIAFRRGHIPGAFFCVRSALADGLKALPAHVRVLVFTASDDAIARFAAADAQALGWSVKRLVGGTHVWRKSGLPMEHGAVRQLSEPNDIWYSPYEVSPHMQEQAMREYIDWEVGLAQRVASEPGIQFTVL